MARQRQVEACFICGGIPCECNKKAPAKRKAKAAPAVAKVPVSTREGPKAPAPDRFAALAKRESSKTAPRRLVEDEATARAIQHLGPILHPDERRRYADIINPRNTEAAKKLAEWRAKHVLHND